MLIAILLFVLFPICVDRQPQLPQLLPSGAVLNLTGNCIEPLAQLTITDELSASIATMDKDDISPAFDSHNLVFGDFQQSGDRAYGDAEFLEWLEAAK